MALGSNKIDKLTIMIFFDSLVFPNKKNRYNSSERNYWQFRPIFRYQELKWRFLSGWTFMRTFGNRLVKIFDSLQDKICWQQLCHLASKMLQILRDQFLFQSGTTSVANCQTLQKYDQTFLPENWSNISLIHGSQGSYIFAKLQLLYVKVGNPDLVLRSYQE